VLADCLTLHKDDSSVVFAIFLLETLQTALSGADAYYWFASGFGKMDHLLDPYVSAFDVPIMGSIVSGTVQLYFVYRVWVLSDRKSWWYCVLIAVVSRLYSTVLTLSCMLILSVVLYYQHYIGLFVGYLCKSVGLTSPSRLTLLGTRVKDVY